MLYRCQSSHNKFDNFDIDIKRYADKALANNSIYRQAGAENLSLAGMTIAMPGYSENKVYRC